MASKYTNRREYGIPVLKEDSLMILSIQKTSMMINYRIIVQPNNGLGSKRLCIGYKVLGYGG